VTLLQKVAGIHFDPTVLDDDFDSAARTSVISDQTEVEEWDAECETAVEVYVDEFGQACLPPTAAELIAADPLGVFA
jgi:hypothetical protein